MVINMSNLSTCRSSDIGNPTTTGAAQRIHSSRFFCENGFWFFRAREGDIGPYSSQNRAEEAFEAFLSLCRNPNLTESFEESQTQELAEGIEERVCSRQGYLYFSVTHNSRRKSHD
jgi:hypothetical protein